MLSLNDLIQSDPNAVRGKRVFIRSDLNAPIDLFGVITDDTRIKASLFAITLCVAAGAKVMVTSHLGRPIESEKECDLKDSLLPVARHLSNLLKQPVLLIKNWVNGIDLPIENGQVVLLENCRCNIGEKNNDLILAQKMASLCDIYVHDAFATAHRKEATTYGMAKYATIACAGPLLLVEFHALTKAFAKPKHPIVAIVGGAKVSTKLSVLKSLAAQVDCLIVGGGIANTFLLASGFAIGKSLAEPEMIDEAAIIIRNKNVPLAIDFICAKACTKDSQTFLRLPSQIEYDDLILDIGPETIKAFVKIIEKAKTIIWNGPVGVFEYNAFGLGTKAIAEAIARASEGGAAKDAAFSIAGGGDTLAAITKYNVSNKISYLSTGGGAFLEFLESKTLPAFEVLNQRAITAFN